MAYATLTMFKRRMGSSTSPLGLYEQLTDRVSGTTANDTVGQELLDEAEAEIHRWLARRYLLPITDSVAVAALAGLALNLAEYGAWAHAAPRKTVPERVKERWESEMQWLRDVASGKADVPAGSALAAAVSSGQAVTTTGHERIFTEDGTGGA